MSVVTKYNDMLKRQVLWGAKTYFDEISLLMNVPFSR